MATLDKNGLWQALETMRIEAEGAPLTFAAKLAQKSGWSPARAERVAAEYRRFLYLAATSPEPVTPSEAIDEAWHLHLTYSRHYWDELCGRILAKPLHHDPGDDGAADDARHQQQYRETLRRYQETFGAPAPADIWPRPLAARPAQLSSRIRTAATVAGAALLLAACTRAFAGSTTGGLADNGDWWILWAIGGFVVIVAVVAMISPNKGRRGGRGDGGGDCGSDSSDGGSSCSGSSCGGGGCGGGGD